ncbi:MAG TPA: hotdog domain-containing protein [Polyangiaceae bacterium]|nr:hotdog domain-containing protein [Polyangiaceae bacterium]
MSTPDYVRAIWGNPQPGRLMGPGHPAGDLLHAPEWIVREETAGRIVVVAPLVPAVQNFRGHLFGGFAPTYVDLLSLRTVSAGPDAKVHGWLLTLNIHVDFFEPVEGPSFVIESAIVNRHARTIFVEIRFKDLEGKLLLLATATLLEQPRA